MSAVTDWLTNKVVNMIARAVIDSINVEEDGTITAKQSVLADDDDEDIEVMQQYGYASVPLKGAESTVVYLGGDRDSGVIIATEDARYRIKNMKGGEVALYTDEGDVIHFKRGRILEVETGTLNAKVLTKATIEAPTVVITGNLEVGGNVSDGTGSLNQLRTEYGLHIHGGVTVGQGLTAGPEAPPVPP